MDLKGTRLFGPRPIVLLGVCVVCAAAVRFTFARGPRSPTSESVSGLFEMLQGEEHEAGAAQEQLELRLGVDDPRLWKTALDSPNSRARSLAVESLGVKRSPETVRMVSDALRDPASSVRLAAVQALSVQDPKLALRPMLSAVRDEDTWVSEAASNKIRELGRREAVPELLIALRNPDRETGVFALSALKRLTGQKYHAGKVDSQERWNTVCGQWETWWNRARKSWPTSADVRDIAPMHPSRSFAAPGFTLRTHDGSNLSLDTLRGKVILLNFWGIGCGPCIVEMPGLDRIARRHAGAGLTVIGVEENGTDVSELKRYASSNGIHYPLAPVTNSMRESYGHIHDVPVSFLIDRQGRIRYQWDGDREESVFESAVRRILSE